MEVPIGAVMDEKKNVYISADTATYKLSPNGEMMWKYKQPGSNPDGPAIMDGAFFGSTDSGHVYSVDLERGQERWVTRAAENGCGDTGFVSAHNGVVLASVGLKQSVNGPACSSVAAVNSSDGSILYMFDPDNGLWDFMAQFVDDESFVFQDMSGVLYRVSLLTGELQWKNGGLPGSWTDGTQFLGSNGIVYQTNNNGLRGEDDSHCLYDGCPGTLGAYRVSDGSFVWKRTVPKPPNTSPVVGRLRPDAPLSVVMPIGQQAPRGGTPPASTLWERFVNLKKLPQFVQRQIWSASHFLSIWLGDRQQYLWGNPDRPHEIHVFDAETGEPSWQWKGPVGRRWMATGDEEAYVARVNKLRTVCWPTPWNAARIGADGTIYVGNENGVFYAIRDANGDNVIDDATEVSSYSTGSNFPSCGSAHAPGMIVVANCEAVLAWKI